MQCYFITQAVDILYGTLCARGLADYGTEGVLVVPDVLGRLALLEEQQGRAMSFQNLRHLFCSCLEFSLSRALFPGVKVANGLNSKLSDHRGW